MNFSECERLIHRLNNRPVIIDCLGQSRDCFCFFFYILRSPQSVAVQRLVTRHLQPVLLQLCLLLHLQHAEEAGGIWGGQVQAGQRPAHGGCIRFVLFTTLQKQSLKSPQGILWGGGMKTANCLLTVKGLWTWSWPRPCGWSTPG